LARASVTGKARSTKMAERLPARRWVDERMTSFS